LEEEEEEEKKCAVKEAAARMDRNTRWEIELGSSHLVPLNRIKENKKWERCRRDF
jgi:hypothetical protein